ncbi:hypothetical protein M3Y97_00573800 [Aphelenchoides bicaudatus]|nr:hypothetical protein M3Y97_00573800 [Aphelenchoides bicaudatus]
MRRSSVQMRLPNEARIDPLEDTEPGDSDRRIDSCSFRREQFDIFKKQFRDAFDEYGHEQLANLTLDGALKKDIVNTLRKLQRAKFALEKLPNQEDTETLIVKISEIYNELSASTKGDTEFTVNNVQLPEYDGEAVQLFFGSQEKDTTGTSINKLQDFNQMFTDKINEVLGAAQLLLNEYEELLAYIKRGGVL